MYTYLNWINTDSGDGLWLICYEAMPLWSWLLNSFEQNAIIFASPNIDNYIQLYIEYAFTLIGILSLAAG